MAKKTQKKKQSKKPSKRSRTPAVSSPVATGGAGTFFEQHVGAMALSLLLTRAIPPILIDCQLEEVHFQAKRLGWETDDMVLVGTRQGIKRRLGLQVKRTFTVSRANEECTKTLGAMWADFCNPSVFDAQTDCLSLAVLRTPAALLNQFGALVECARASADATDFSKRLNTQGLLSAEVVNCYREVHAICAQFSKEAVSDDAVWRFLRVFHLLSYDLNTPTRKDEAWIKSLLAHSAQETDRLAAAETTWTELLRFASGAMQSGADVRRDQLPKAVVKRHGQIPSEVDNAITKISEHSSTTLGTIRSTAGSVSIAREAIQSKLVEAINSSRVTVIAGAAGSGKSALAKSVVQRTSEHNLVLAFRAEEFAVPHLDQALALAQIPATMKALRETLCGQARKLVLVESVERLLESSTRDAFQDLLTTVADDPSWRIVLTCRDYSLDTVNSAFLSDIGTSTQVLRVPLLTDGELAQVVQCIPALAVPLANARLRELLRNPYILDKAAKMEWKTTGALPADERTFRDKCWREVVRRDDQAQDGLPQRRHAAFLELCVRRAQALRPFVPCGDLDQAALLRLHQDGLIEIAPNTNGQMAASAHDVLEDWAILKWIAERHTIHSDTAVFVAEVCVYPAIRRAFRQWLGEYLESDPIASATFVNTVLSTADVAQQTKDDTLIAVLTAHSVDSFFQRNRDALLADGASLLKRTIHLVRIACKTAPDWAPRGMPAVFLIPHGTAWPAVLGLVRQNLSVLLPSYVGLLVGLISDWSVAVSYWNPHPAGMADAAAIGFACLPHLPDYGDKDLRLTALKVLIKIPKGDPNAMDQLVKRAIAKAKDHRIDDSAAEDFCTLALDWMESINMCRDAPDSVIAIAEARLMIPEEELPDTLESRADIDEFFGLADDLRYTFMPTSAFQGPFLALLRSDARKGTDFILRLADHGTTCYAKSGGHSGVEKPWQVELKWPNGDTTKQWCSGRLWSMYRATSVGPDVLESALMALEFWLLELCEKHPSVVSEWLEHLLKKSSTVAITAVVASVATSHPQLAGDTALALLSVPEFFELDKVRMVHESQSAFSLLENGLKERICGDERRRSKALPHRGRDLEILAFQLQFGPAREHVLKLLDAYAAALPPAAMQGEEDKLFRLSLRRMDSRHYEISTEVPPEPTVQTDDKRGKRVILKQKVLEPDLERMVNAQAPRMAALNTEAGHWLWARKAFENDPAADKDWQPRLEAAKKLAKMRQPQMAVDRQDTIQRIAAVCIRDHWSEMNAKNRQWCTSTLVSSVMDGAEIPGGEYPSMFAEPQLAAFALPAVLARSDDNKVLTRVRQALDIALTHRSPRVVADAASGIGHFFKGKEIRLVLPFARVVALRSTREAELNAAEAKLPWNQRQDHALLSQQAAEHARRENATGQPLTASELEKVSLDTWEGRNAAAAIFSILSVQPEHPLRVLLLTRTAEWLQQAWHDANRFGSGDRRRRDFTFEQEALHAIAKTAMSATPATAQSICQPVFAAVGQSPGEVAKFVKALIVAADRVEGASNFWSLWEALAKMLASAPWLQRLQHDHSSHSEMIEAMFLNGQWKEGVTHWHVLDGHAHLLDKLFETLPVEAPVFGAYCQFLYEVGSKSMPSAFERLAARLKAAHSANVLGKPNTMYHLESILRRFVYGRPDSLKANPSLRDSVLYLLDTLVEMGSSVAYRMRDDFVTPYRAPKIKDQA